MKYYFYNEPFPAIIVATDEEGANKAFEHSLVSLASKHNNPRELAADEFANLPKGISLRVGNGVEVDAEPNVESVVAE